jgi:hypothetical protein
MDRFNNLSRARSYSLPRELNTSLGAEQTSKPVAPNQPAAEPANALSQQQAPVTQLQRDGGEAGNNRLRALFVLQLAEPPAASIEPADAANPEVKPAEPAAPAEKKR